MKTIKIIGIVFLSVLVVGLSAGLLIKSDSGSNSSKSGGVNVTKFNSAIAEFTEELELQQSAIEELQDRTYTQLYTHHFDVAISLEALGLTDVDPDNGCCAVINFNVLSNNSTPYEKLSDMEGDGYIASAFGRFVSLYDNVPVSPVFSSIVFDCRLVYEGTLWVNVVSTSGFHALIENGCSYFIPNMGNYVVADSVTPV